MTLVWKYVDICKCFEKISMNRKRKSSSGQKSLTRKLVKRYKLVVMDEASFEEKIRLRITRWGIIVLTGSIAIVLVIFTAYLIAFTSLREYIPGYTDTSLSKRIYDLQQKTDSLEREFNRKDVYISNLKKIIEGEEIIDDVSLPVPADLKYDTISNRHSGLDSALRAEFETQSMYNLHQSRNYNPVPVNFGNINLFPPLRGIVTRSFDAGNNHFGVDIVASQNVAIKSTLDGTVIFSDWTLETGYVIGIQHQNNIISVYKHNSALLKQQGTFVKAGETIAIVGESGELTTGPHLHFELWYNGNPVNPEEYIAF
jgi:murein DD-endopeptidase MepM/ murein hydrolase activator NlpD